MATLDIRVDVSVFPTTNANVDADRAGQPTNFQWIRGGKNQLKRVTSIGQTQGLQNFSTNSFVHEVRWESCVIGATMATAVPWVAANTINFVKHPGNGVVEVDFVSNSRETVSIDI